MEKRYQVFVSSTYTDLIEERKAATQAILKCNCFPAGMELFPASNKTQWEVIKKVIDDSDFYLVIIAGRYGSLGLNDERKRVSYTEMEFDYALSQGKPIIAMLHSNPETLSAKLSEKTATGRGRLEKFREKAKSGRMTAFWENKDQLHGEISHSLRTIIADTPEVVGWIRATSIPYDDDNEETLLSLAVSKFKAISNASEKIDYLEELSYSLRRKCIAEKEFLKDFIGLINTNQSDDIISRAINWIPYNLSAKTIEYLDKQINIDALFGAQCKNGKIQDSARSASIIQLLENLNRRSMRYAIPIWNTLKAGEISSERRDIAIQYVGYSASYTSDTLTRKGILNYIQGELDNSNRVLSLHNLMSLFAALCVNENDFLEICNSFFANNMTIQKEILNCIFDGCGADMWIVTPRIQRIFFDLCDQVYSWNDDETTKNLLLYCLFTRTYDVYTVEEVFDQLNSFNDDVFYMFFWDLGFGEFGHGTEEHYVLDDKEKARVIQIIKNRKHPREGKLLERFL